MALKYRSRVNYAQIHAGDKGGFNLGLDGSVFLRKEAVARTFQIPRIGTQGKSTSAATPSQDITAGPDTSVKVNVDGTGDVTATIASLVSLDTGAEIADALELAINNALTAAGKSARVWVQWTTVYIVSSQSTGLLSSVVITPAALLDLTTELKLGTAAAGTEVVGVDDQDFLLYTTGGPTFNQPTESNTHRSGRFHSGIVKKKKVAEFSLSTFMNMNGLAGASIDTAYRLLWEQLLGTEEVSAGSFIKYTQGHPNFTFSMARVSTIFGEYYTGGYVRECQLEFPGEGPATNAWSGKASTRSIAGLGKLSAASVASATVALQANEGRRYTAGAFVMAMDADGVTILYGAGGDLTIASRTDGAVVLSAPVSLPINAYLVPWHPGAMQQTGRDAIMTDLVGSFKLRTVGPSIDVTNISLNLVNDHTDLDGYFGRSANSGFVAGARLTATLSTTFDLSNENFGEVVQSEDFAGFDPEIVLGDTASGRYFKLSTKKWIPSVPSIEVPENGTTPVTLEGILFQSTPGAQDPFVALFG